MIAVTRNSNACRKCGGFGTAHNLNCPTLKLPTGYRHSYGPTLAEVIAKEGIKPEERLQPDEAA